MRVRAQRPRAFAFGRSGERRGNLVWRFPLFDPLLERGEHVERIRTVAAAAVPHPRRHEQAIGVIDAGAPPEARHDALVVLRAASGGDLRIAPAVILNQLPTAIEERLDVRIERVDRVGVLFLGANDVGIEVEPG